MTRIEQLQGFLALDPKDSFTRYAIGLEQASAGDHTAAIKTFEELRQLDPGYIPTYYQLAASYNALSDITSAANIYRVGIVKAREATDLHALSELQAASEDLGED